MRECMTPDGRSESRFRADREAVFGRRSFLKGAAASLGLAAVGMTACSQTSSDALGESDVQEPPEEQVFVGVCHGSCSGGAHINVHVRDGKIVKTSIYDKDDPIGNHICPRGLTHAQRTYAPERIQYPMRRVEGTARGAGEWERITWDEAVDEITAKWKEYIAEDPRSVSFMYMTGTNCYNMYIYWRLANAFGGTIFDMPSCMAALEIGKDAFGRAEYVVGNDTMDIMNAKNIFIWGSNLTVAFHSKVRLVWEARKAGAKLICIDPNFTDIAAKADQWVPVRPGSDGVLAMAMTKVIIDAGKADFDYMAKNTTSAFLVKDDGYTCLHAADVGLELEMNSADAMGSPLAADEYGRPVDYIVMSEDGMWGTPDVISNPVFEGEFEVNGIKCKPAFQLLVERIAEWTPERAAEVCDVPAETIVELANAYADSPSSLWLGFGPGSYCNGDTTTECQFALAIVAGKVGKPGCSISGNQGSMGTTGILAVDWMSTMYPPEPVFTGFTSVPIAYLPEIQETGQFRGVPLNIKSLFLYDGNFLTCGPDKNAQLEMLDKVELLIGSDSVMTDTMRYCDYVLPVSHWFEYSTVMTQMTDKIKYSEKAIDPLFESKSDVEIACMFGRAMGFSGFDLDDDTFCSLFFGNEYCQAMGWTWDRIKEEKIVQWGTAPYIYGNLEYGTTWMNTPKRATFFFENPVALHDSSKELDKAKLALPNFTLPAEAWAETVGGYEKTSEAEKYPLQIISYRDRMKVHSMWALSPQLLEIQSEPSLSMNPEDAQARGVAEGDIVRVFNDRGEMVIKAHMDPSFRPGVIKSEHGWFAEQYIGGSLNSLTLNKISHWKPAPEHFDCMVEVEKYNL